MNEMMELRRKSILVDLFITGTNAIREMGQLVNLDMIGNRVSAMMWGPKNILLIVGRNKICSDIEDAMIRIKSCPAPVNTMNLDKKTPCKSSDFLYSRPSQLGSTLGKKSCSCGSRYPCGGFKKKFEKQKGLRVLLVFIL